MIFHLLQYRLKCFLKDRQMIFWTLIFPLLLATLFNLAFANLTEIDTFIEIPVAVVEHEAYRQNEALQMALAAASIQNGEGGLFRVTPTDEETARQLLAENQVDGIIFAEPDLHLVVKQSGLNQTILKSFLDDFSQTSQALSDIIAVNATISIESLLPVVQDRRDHISTVPISKDQLNSTVIYFYSLIAMTALYGGFWGMRIVNENQANLSTQGARASVAPVHKLLRLMVDISAALVIQYGIILVVIAYIQLVLGYRFGSQLGWILLAALIACFMGIAYGSCIGAIVRTGEGIKTGILILSTMIMSFLSGMMYHGIKYIVTTAVPVLAFLNPANLITDAFLALYYDGASPRYFTNLAILLAFGLTFSLLAFAVLRRQRYASL